MSFNGILLTTIVPTLFLLNGTVVLAEPIRWEDHPDGRIHWYELVTVDPGLNWTDARQFAEDRDYNGAPGHLATITSTAENNVVATLATGMAIGWLGGFQPTGSPEPDGNWQWVTDEPWGYTNWSSGEPNNILGGESALEMWGTIAPNVGVELGQWNDGRDHILRQDFIVEYTLPVLEVLIDIKPGSYPNSVNLGSNGVVPVAVLSSADFDATQVDPETVTLAGAGVAVRGKGNRYLSHHEDVNDDGIVDLVCQVETVNLEPDTFQDGFACLTGETVDGKFIEGWDEISVVPSD